MCLLDAINAANIAPTAVHITMLHRLLAVHRHPAGCGGVLCPYCHLASAGITDHLLCRCPLFFLQHLYLAWRLLRHRIFPPLGNDFGANALHLRGAVRTPNIQLRLTTGAQDYPNPLLSRRPRPTPSCTLAYLGNGKSPTRMLTATLSSPPHGCDPQSPQGPRSAAP